MASSPSSMVSGLGTAEVGWSRARGRFYLTLGWVLMVPKNESPEVEYRTLNELVYRFAPLVNVIIGFVP